MCSMQRDVQDAALISRLCAGVREEVGWEITSTRPGLPFKSEALSRDLVAIQMALKALARKS